MDWTTIEHKIIKTGYVKSGLLPAKGYRDVVIDIPEQKGTDYVVTLQLADVGTEFTWITPAVATRTKNSFTARFYNDGSLSHEHTFGYIVAE